MCCGGGGCGGCEEEEEEIFAPKLDMPFSLGPKRRRDAAAASAQDEIAAALCLELCHLANG